MRSLRIAALFAVAMLAWVNTAAAKEAGDWVVRAGVTHIDPKSNNGSLVVDGREVWAQAEKGNGKIWLRIVRTKPMEQVIVADAASLGNALRASGHITVEGIYFDTGTAAIKPESARAIAEIAKLLQTSPDLDVYVVGHTDATGTVEGNLKLSRDRADAVLGALVRDHGIAASRLRSFGNGPFAPVAANDTEDGRARNRRVELVRP